MSGPINAAEKAVYDALSAGAPQWTIYQHVPQDTAPPMHIIGDLVASGALSKDEDDARLNMDILTVFQGEERKPVTDEQERIKTALHEVTLSEGDFEIKCYRTGARAELLEDGETYLGTSTFTVWALSA